MFRAVLTILWLITSSKSESPLDIYFQQGMSGSIIGSSSYLVLTIDKLGLANRLRIMAGAYAVAKHFRRNLLILWASSDECSASFSDLFQSIPVGMQVANIVPTPHQTIERSLRDSAERLQFRFSSVYWTGFEISNLSPANNSRKEITIAWTLGSHFIEGASCHDYLFAKSLFYRRLEPVDFVRNIVNSFIDDYFSHGLVVGLHIRAFDPLYDWEVVPPDVGEEGEAATTKAGRFDMVTVERFRAIILQLNSRRPSIKFFIASNSPEAIKGLRELHSTPDNIIFSDRDKMICSAVDSATCASSAGAVSGSRSTVFDIQMALADFLLLANTAVVIHTRGSSFAREAGYMRSIPVIDVFRDIAVYTSDPALQDCGLDEFHRLNVHNPIQCYDEAGDRRMCTRSVSIEQCKGDEPNDPLRFWWGYRHSGLVLYCARRITDGFSAYEENEIGFNPSQFSILAESNGYSL